MKCCVVDRSHLLTRLWAARSCYCLQKKNPERTARMAGMLCVIFPNIKDQYLRECREKQLSHTCRDVLRVFRLGSGIHSLWQNIFPVVKQYQTLKGLAGEGAGIMKSTLQSDLEVSQPRGLHINNPNQHIQAFYENKHWKVGD